MTDQEFQGLILQQFQQLNTRFDTLETKVGTLETKFDALETKVDKIDTSQVRMENELTEKIRGLYDFREVQNDINEKIIYSLNRIEAKLDVLQMETASVRRVK